MFPLLHLLFLLFPRFFAAKRLAGEIILLRLCHGQLCSGFYYVGEIMLFKGFDKSLNNGFVKKQMHFKILNIASVVSLYGCFFANK